MTKPSRANIGDCGEYYVASYLSGMGVKVTVERVNTPLKDLRLTFGGRSVSLQVKTGRAYNYHKPKKKPEEAAWVWRVGAKAEKN